MKKLLVVVDYQKDFVDGSLASPAPSCWTPPLRPKSPPITPLVTMWSSPLTPIPLTI